jgi:hypothetical protein
MSDREREGGFPAVAQIRDALRADLMRAARANPGMRSRLIGRRRLAMLTAAALVVAPAGLAGAGAFDSSDARLEFECPAAKKLFEKLHGPVADVVLGAPAEGPGAVDAAIEDPSETSPENPCDESDEDAKDRAH